MTLYENANGRTYKISEEGERTQLANFTAEIIEEIRFVDGSNIETQLRIKGERPEEIKAPDPKRSTEEPTLKPLPEILITADDFTSMRWVMQSWGVRCIITPGANNKEELRVAIQASSTPKIIVVYKHIGWDDIQGQRAYLHNGGAITKTGNKVNVQVSLCPELQRYNLAYDKAISTKDAVAATLSLSMLADPAIMWPLIAGCVAPLFGPVDFGIHVTGRTGTFKSEVVSLLQSHYGVGMDARHLPASWSATGNALEALAYYAANALLVIDDFVPTGTSWQVRNYHTTADKIIRAQGNQAGRARLTDISKLQTTMYPRGMVLSTGEDTPEGHSVRARLLILELSPGDIAAESLSKAQKNRGYYPVTVANLIQYLAEHPMDLKGRAETVRDANINLGHTRTPSMVGALVASVEAFIEWAGVMKYITAKKEGELIKEATAGIMAAAEKQSYYLEAADPVELFMSTLRHILNSGLGHMRTLQGGIPKNPTLLGWTVEASYNDVATYKSHGPTLGWVSWEDDEMYLDATAGYNAIRKVAGNDMTTTKQTMLKRLKDAAVMTRCDDTRQRNTVRITADSHNRQVVSLCLSAMLDTQEKPDDEEEA